MKYVEFKEQIYHCLLKQPDGLTWAELREELRLPYSRTCPEWTRCLEQEIGLMRIKQKGRALVWKLPV